MCIACTQLDNYGYNERKKKRVLIEWIDFLRTNTRVFNAVHFNSCVPQALFDAVCCQENLEELRFKWGTYSDLSALGNLKNIKFLYIGSGAKVQDITMLKNLKTLVVLHVENFKKIQDYSVLVALNKLEQLIISGPMLGVTPIKDLDFLPEMQKLLSFWNPDTTIRKKYTPEEFAALRAAIPNVYTINNCMSIRKANKSL